MSVKAMGWAAESPLTGTDRWVLLALAWFADDRTGTAYPGQKAIGTWAGLAPRTVREALVRLEADGWIVREHRRTEGGWRTSDLYRLTTGRAPERERRKDAAAERREALPAPGAASPTGAARRMSPSGASRRSQRREAPGKEELRSSEPSVEPLARETPAAPEPLVEIESPEAVKPKRRPSRLPEGWQPSAAGRALAAERVPWFTPADLVEQFRDYWTAASGRNAVKVDWDAAFRTWVRNAVTYGPPRGWTPPPTAQVENPGDDYERRIRAWLNRGGVDYGEWRAALKDPDLMDSVLSYIGTPAPVR